MERAGVDVGDVVCFHVHSAGKGVRLRRQTALEIGGGVVEFGFGGQAVAVGVPVAGHFLTIHIVAFLKPFQFAPLDAVLDGIPPKDLGGGVFGLPVLNVGMFVSPHDGLPFPDANRAKGDVKRRNIHDMPIHVACPSPVMAQGVPAASEKHGFHIFGQLGGGDPVQAFRLRRKRLGRINRLPASVPVEFPSVHWHVTTPFPFVFGKAATAQKKYRPQGTGSRHLSTFLTRSKE